jgi:tetrahydromethanopterin S-methyltransferase subunit G
MMDLAFLDGLDRRMQFIAVTEAIVRRSGRDMDLFTFIGRLYIVFVYVLLLYIYINCISPVSLTQQG